MASMGAGGMVWGYPGGTTVASVMGPERDWGLVGGGEEVLCTCEHICVCLVQKYVCVACVGGKRVADLFAHQCDPTFRSWNSICPQSTISTDGRK